MPKDIKNSFLIFSILLMLGFILISWIKLPPIFSHLILIILLLGVAWLNILIKKNHQQLKESENRFRSAFDFSAIGMALIAPNGDYLQVNAAMLEMLGYSENELLAFNIRKIMHAEDFTHNEIFFKKMLDKKIKTYHATQRYLHKNGELVWLSVSISLVNDDRSTPLYFVVQMQNITAEKNAEEKLRYLAYHDSLTGLLNRSRLEQEMRDILALAQRQESGFALVFIDLDHFKNINDVMGHDAGDILLRVVAERLKNTVRDTDIVSRLGGDEFVVVITHLNKVDALANIVQKILDNLLKPIIIRGNELYITASVGVSVYPFDGHDIQILMKNADLALYRAKEIGRNNYQFCTPEMTSKAREKIARQNALVQAFVKNEFVLHYQPKLNLITQKITGVEALLRWQSEQYGLVAPNEIIHLAEESGLIIPLNEWVLKTAVKQVKAWHAEGLCPLTVAINLSSRQFKQANLSDSILHALDEVGFSPDSVEMEVTESLIMQDPDLVLNSLQALKQQGISIAIDDFGTGYSSLEYIRRFSMDTVKIDKKFIHQMTKDSVSASIVSAIIAMANKLGIKTTAEGVETREQYDLLLKEKCTEIQGFYLSKPLDAEKMGLFLKDPLVISALTNLSKMSD